MKKFQNPQIKIILVEDNDLICTSGVEGVSEGTDKPVNARQRNPIWDDYE